MPAPEESGGLDSTPSTAVHEARSVHHDPGDSWDRSAATTATEPAADR
jgi:hypothetical protein